MGHPDPIDRFWEKVDLSGRCWLWRGSLNNMGYGQFGLKHGHNVLAHRFIYEQLCGAIPTGLDLDHLCHNDDLACAGGRDCCHRACVNPAHLEPVSRFVNTARGVLGRITHCPHGHPYDADNTYLTPQGRRRCRACRREGMRRYKAAKRSTEDWEREA